MHSDKFLSLDNLEFKKFFSLLIDLAKYSEDELETDYRFMIDWDRLSQKTSSKSYTKYADYQSLASRNGLILDFLGKVEDSYDAKKDQQELIFDVIFSLVKSMEMAIEDFRGEHSFSTDLGKKNIFACQLINIFSQIFTKKDDRSFIETLKKMIDDEFYKNSNDRNVLLIVMLKNLCIEKSSNELSLGLKAIKSECLDQSSSLISEEFFKYLNQKIITQHVFDNAQDHIDKIKKINPTFDKEAQVFLNYFRSIDCINDKLKCGIDHILPEINIWAYNFYQRDCSPSRDEINEFRKILELNVGEDKKPLCEFLARNITKEIFDNDGIRILEISELDFIAKLLDKLSTIESARIAKLKQLEISDLDMNEMTSLVNSWKKEEFISLLTNDLLKIAQCNQLPTSINEVEEQFLSKKIEQICQKDLLRRKKIEVDALQQLRSEKSTLFGRVSGQYFSKQHGSFYDISPEELEEKIFNKGLKSSSANKLYQQFSHGNKTNKSPNSKSL